MQEQSYNDSGDNTIISFLSKQIGKVFKFNVKVTFFNYKFITQIQQD